MRKSSILLLLLLLAVYSFAQSLSASFPSQSDVEFKTPKLVLRQDSTSLSGGKKLLTYAGFMTASFIMLNNHEIGHTVVARLAGDNTASYSLYKKKPDGSTCIGCNSYAPEKLSRFGKTMVPLGGIMFSQSLSKLCDLSLKNIPMGHNMQRFVAGTYLVTKFDMSFQVIQEVLRTEKFPNGSRTGPADTDMVSFGYYASNGHRGRYRMIQIGMVALTALDIYLSRKTIKKNWKILFNKHYYKKERNKYY